MAGRTAGSGLVKIDDKSIRDLQNVAKIIRASADKKTLTERLNGEIREAAEPMRRDIVSAARGLRFQSSSRAGASRARRTGRTLKSGKFKAGKGLRESLAGGIRTQITASGQHAGVRIRLASRDADVNRIGKRINARGGVRHPLFGNRESWHETKTANGRDWFYQAARPHMGLTQRRIAVVLDRWVADLASRIDRAA